MTAFAQKFEVDKNASITHISSSNLEKGEIEDLRSYLSFVKIELEFVQDNVHLTTNTNTYNECLDSFILDCKVYKDAIVWDDKYVFDLFNSDLKEKELKTFLKNLPKAYKLNEQYYKNTFYIFKNDNLNGLKNHYGEIVLDAKFNLLMPVAELFDRKYQSLYKIKENGREYLYDANKGRLDKKDYEKIGTIFNGTILAIDDSKAFLLDSNGKDLNNGKYDLLKSTSARNCKNYIFVKNDKWAIADRKGNLVSEMKYDEIIDFGKNIFKIKIDDNWGIMDNEEKLIIDPIYTELSGFDSDTYIAKTDEETSLFFKNGKLRFKSNYKGIVNANENLLIVKTNENNYGYANWDGELVIEDKFDFAKKFKSGLAIVKIDDYYGIIDTKGKTIIDNKYIKTRKALK